MLINNTRKTNIKAAFAVTYILQSAGVSVSNDDHWDEEILPKAKRYWTRFSNELVESALESFNKKNRTLFVRDILEEEFGLK